MGDMRSQITPLRQRRRVLLAGRYSVSMAGSPLDKEGWEAALNELAGQIEEWVRQSRAKGMNIEYKKMALDPGRPLAEVVVGSSAVFYLEPAEFAWHRVPAIAFLYAYPSLRRIQLRGPAAGAWEVLSRDGIPMRYGWTSHEFLALLADLADVPDAKGA